MVAVKDQNYSGGGGGGGGGFRVLKNHHRQRKVHSICGPN